MWYFTSRSEFLVKSAYRVEIEKRKELEASGANSLNNGRFF